MGLFDDKTIEKMREDKFNKAIAEGMSLRDAEMAFHTSDEIPQSAIKGVNPQPLKILFYFKTAPEVELVKRHFNVLEYVELNTSDTELLLRLLLALETGIIKEDDLPCLKKSENQL
ncbi:MAG: hypothetical protein WC444_07025 [Candidatus Paceibacterota bacterium]